MVVWIVKQAKEEHRSAIEWLNNNTNNELNFFLIELHAYKIDDSNPAPMFEVIEKPNGFIKNTKAINNQDNLNKSQSERLEFWNKFNEVVEQNGKPFNIRKATTDHWYDVALGTSEAHISINLVNKSSYVVIDVYINDNKELFDKLMDKKDIIESELGFKLVWDRLDNGKASRIKYRIKGLNFDDHSNYEELMKEIIDKVIIMRAVFKKYM